MPVTGLKKGVSPRNVVVGRESESLINNGLTKVTTNMLIVTKITWTTQIIIINDKNNNKIITNITNDKNNNYKNNNNKNRIKTIIEK